MDHQQQIEAVQFGRRMQALTGKRGRRGLLIGMTTATTFD
jgi:hypothetical protein